MNNHRASLIAICTTLLSSTSIQAAFDPAVVPADSQWVVYLNFNTLRESEVGRHLLEVLPVTELTQGDDPIRPNIGKILETIGSITAFGIDFPKDPQSANGALVLQGTQDLRTIVDGLLAQLSITHPELIGEVAGLPFDAYAVKGGNGAGNAELVVALPSEPIVIISKSREQLLNALQVFRKQAPSMGTRRSALSALVPQTGAYYVIAASNVPSNTMFPANAPQSRILQMAQSVSVAIGEETDQVVARLQLGASTDDLAVKLEKIVNGVIAMASLAESSDERLSEFIHSFQSVRDGRSIRLQMSYPTERVIEMIETITNPPAPPPSVAHPFSPPGTEIARWVADANPGDDATGAANFVTHVIENVRLETGTTIVLSSSRNDGENGRFDYVDVVPAGNAGQRVRLEAEFMRLNNYRIERVPHASGSEVIIINGSPSDARHRWTGAPGNYTLHVGYVDENDGASPFAVSLIEPDSAAAAGAN